MKKIFQIGPTILALKLDEGRVLGGNYPLQWTFFACFSNHEDDMNVSKLTNLNKFWYGVI